MSYVVFCDVGGTLFEGTPWPMIRKHPAYNKTRGQIELWKFLPVYILSKVHILSETQLRNQWLARMAATFANMSREAICQIYRDVIADDLQTVLRTNVIEQLQGHKQQGATVMLVSGIFTDLVGLLAQHIGVDGAIGTQVEFVNDIATGRLSGEPCVGQTKIDYIQQYMQAAHPHVNLQDCYGYADSYSDRALLSAVGHGIAIYPDKQIEQMAQENGWNIFQG